jgi:hypothetical protein
MPGQVTVNSRRRDAKIEKNSTRKGKLESKRRVRGSNLGLSNETKQHRCKSCETISLSHPGLISVIKNNSSFGPPAVWIWVNPNPVCLIWEDGLFVYLKIQLYHWHRCPRYSTVSLTPLSNCCFRIQYLREFEAILEKGFNMCICGPGQEELFYEKKQRTKILCQGPFK